MRKREKKKTVGIFQSHARTAVQGFIWVRIQGSKRLPIHRVCANIRERRRV